LRCIPVKIFHSVRACGRAISATDASIADLRHKAFFVFISGIDRADSGTRRVIAMHARPGEKSRFNMRIFSLDIRNYFYPIDGPSLCRLIGTDDPDIILCMTGNGASLAPSAFIQINDHPPTMHYLPPDNSLLTDVGNPKFEARNTKQA